ncbi:MAG: secretin and TonB N-terminal domain-containing protein [bacterium]|nr:secretin and TonB N-terminal domain-containing protein [bacterium]
MRFSIVLLIRTCVCLLLTAQLSGCATYWTERRADKLIAQGQAGEGVNLLQDLSRKDPTEYRLKYIGARDKATRDLMQRAQLARAQGRTDDALAVYQEILTYDPQHADALHGLEVITRDQRNTLQLAETKAALDKGDQTTALQLLSEILAENPYHPEARQIRQSIEQQRNREMLAEPVLKASLKKPVSLEFRNASIQAIFEVLSQSSGISFIFDKDVKVDARTTLFAKNTSIEDALNLILRTNQLNQKVLNDSTLLIYPATGDKEKQYEDLVMRTFYLGNVDPKKMQDMVRTLVAPKSMYVDENLKMLVVRDSLSVIETVERLIGAYDLADPEVTLEVEILEVSSDSSLNLGVQYPDQVKVGVFGAANKSGQLTVNELQNINSKSFQLFFPDPLAVLNLKQTSGKARTLANPRIRVSNHEKAKVLVGDKVPVITTTTNQTSSASSESVSYLDVGLKLEVQPEIHVNNDVSININLEVSNIVKEVKSTTGLLTYQIGTRNASTTLRLRDGETQVLAGLIKDEQHDSASHFPGLGKIPFLGRLFSNETNTKTKSEIVLLITPHVVRSLATPAAHILEFSSGTGSEASTHPLRLTPAARYSNADQKLLNGAVSSRTVRKSATASLPTAVPVSPVLPASVDEVPDAMQRIDPAIANIKLDMVAPAQIPVNKEFTLALMLNSPGFDGLEFDIAFDQPGIELVRSTPVAATESFEAKQSEQVVHVTVGKMPASSSPLVMLTLKASQITGAPVTIVMHSAQAHKGEDVSLLVSTAMPRQLQITP